MALPQTMPAPMAQAAAQAPVGLVAEAGVSLPAPTVVGPNIKGKREEYQLVRRLQEALFGGVYEARGLSSSRAFAIKVLQKDEIRKGQMGGHADLCEAPLSEIRFADAMRNCENIMELEEYFEDAFCFYIVFELARGGDLLEALKKQPQGLNETHAQYLLLQATKGLALLHRRRVAMQDVSLENMLLYVPEGRSTFTVKLCDPGQAVVFEVDGHGQEITVPFKGLVGKSFRPPELLEEKPYLATKVDSWCLGWSAFYLLTAQPLFMSADAAAQDPDWLLFKGGEFTALCKQKGAKFSSVALDFIMRLLQPEPDKRMSITDALDHAWFADPSIAPMPAPPKDETPLRDKSLTEARRPSPDTKVSSNQASTSVAGSTPGPRPIFAAPSQPDLRPRLLPAYLVAREAEGSRGGSGCFAVGSKNTDFSGGSLTAPVFAKNLLGASLPTRDPTKTSTLPSNVPPAASSTSRHAGGGVMKSGRELQPSQSLFQRLSLGGLRALIHGTDAGAVAASAGSAGAALPSPRRTPSPSPSPSPRRMGGDNAAASSTTTRVGTPIQTIRSTAVQSPAVGSGENIGAGSTKLRVGTSVQTVRSTAVQSPAVGGAENVGAGNTKVRAGTPIHTIRSTAVQSPAVGAVALENISGDRRAAWTYRVSGLEGPAGGEATSGTRAQGDTQVSRGEVPQDVRHGPPAREQQSSWPSSGVRQVPHVWLTPRAVLSSAAAVSCSSERSAPATTSSAVKRPGSPASVEHFQAPSLSRVIVPTPPDYTVPPRESSAAVAGAAPSATFAGAAGLEVPPVEPEPSPRASARSPTLIYLPSKPTLQTHTRSIGKLHGGGKLLDGSVEQVRVPHNARSMTPVMRAGMAGDSKIRYVYRDGTPLAKSTAAEAGFVANRANTPSLHHGSTTSRTTTPLIRGGASPGEQMPSGITVGVTGNASPRGVSPSLASPSPFGSASPRSGGPCLLPGYVWSSVRGPISSSSGLQRTQSPTPGATAMKVATSAANPLSQMKR